MTSSKVAEAMVVLKFVAFAPEHLAYLPLEARCVKLKVVLGTIGATLLGKELASC